jgi:LmbE family N-acetylglucosaminyl deacetylase
MTPLPKLSARDRVLVLAPHPDDESLATGALIQRAVAAHAKVRVIFATDGENNPWPQRVVERKWNITPEDRARWGMRRRRESMLALSKLGVSGNAARFLGLPDQGITGMLLAGDERPLAALSSLMREWQPSVIAIPSPGDVHPDHSALYVYVQLALDHARLDRDAITELRFIVHSGGRQSSHRRTAIELHPDEKAIKSDAILCHESQMALSRKRFVAYAKDIEAFYAAQPATEMQSHHPIRHAAIENGALTLNLHARKTRTPFKGATLFIAIESGAAGTVRWALPMPGRSRRVHVRDAGTDELLRMATVRIEDGDAEVNLPIAPLLPIERLFVKLERRMVFYDHAGWREVPVPRAAASDERPSIAHAAGASRVAG